MFLNAFLLGYKNVNEYDRRYFLLTEEFGRIEALCRSVSKTKSKLAGHLELPNFVWAELIETGSGFQLTQALSIETFPQIISQPELLKSVLSTADFLNNFLKPELCGETFFFWREFLFDLEKKESLPLVEARFFLKSLRHFGFFPDLSFCANCQKDLTKTGGIFFEGHCFCCACAEKNRIIGESVSSLEVIFLKEPIFQTGMERTQVLGRVLSYFRRQAEFYSL